MRDQLNMIVGQKCHKYSDIVHKYLSTKLRFTKNERYIISENDFILWEMWMRVWAIWQEYWRLDPKKDLNSLVDSTKFNYLESIESKAKN